SGGIELINEGTVLIADVPATIPSERDSFRVEAPLAAAKAAGQRLGVGQHVGVVGLKTGKGLAVEHQDVGRGIDDGDLVVRDRAGSEVGGNRDGQSLDARMKVLQSVPEASIGQSEHRGVNGAVAVDQGGWVQPQTGEDAAEGIDTGAQLVEGVARGAADADETEVNKGLCWC